MVVESRRDAYTGYYSREKATAGPVAGDLSFETRGLLAQAGKVTPPAHWAARVASREDEITSRATHLKRMDSLGRKLRQDELHRARTIG